MISYPMFNVENVERLVVLSCVYKYLVNGAEESGVMGLVVAQSASNKSP